MPKSISNYPRAAGKATAQREFAGGGRSYHLCASVEKALELLRKDKNIFTGTAEETFTAIMKNKAAGKQFYTGCNNESADGKCNGHAPGSPDL